MADPKKISAPRAQIKERKKMFKIKSLEGLTSKEKKNLQESGDINGWETGIWTQSHLGETGRTHESEYLDNSHKVVMSNIIFSHLEDTGFLNSENISNAIEFGCNLGRNLNIAKERYDCEVHGIDINQEVIDKCNERFSTNNFFKADLDDGKFLSRYKDNQFDLGITCGFLLHVPAWKGKQSLISEICRICKRAWFFEWRDESVVREWWLRGGVATGEYLDEYYKNNIQHVSDFSAAADSPYSSYGLYTFDS